MTNDDTNAAEPTFETLMAEVMPTAQRSRSSPACNARLVIAALDSFR
jgi:hypothetical protein